ncbi:unnamed protein product [Caenorhabditis sp. 36 PRJEB53466]|nr:unnamed protein product [Caenorhabditis sp. 36 PRJEB53466]
MMRRVVRIGVQAIRTPRGDVSAAPRCSKMPKLRKPFTAMSPFVAPENFESIYAQNTPMTAHGNILHFDFGEEMPTPEEFRELEPLSSSTPRRNRPKREPLRLQNMEYSVLEKTQESLSTDTLDVQMKPVPKTNIVENEKKSPGKKISPEWAKLVFGPDSDDDEEGNDQESTEKTKKKEMSFFEKSLPQKTRKLKLDFVDDYFAGYCLPQEKSPARRTSAKSKGKTRPSTSISSTRRSTRSQKKNI